MKYYTIDNTDIVDLYYNQPLDPYVDSDTTIGMESVEIEKALKDKYGNLMTEDALELSAANRIILEGEMAAKKYGSTLEIKAIDLWDKIAADNGEITFQYSITALVKPNAEGKDQATLKGTLVMKDIEGVWRVNLFSPGKGELGKLIQFGGSEQE